tara:strand:+ start:453 stop:629 length:177 start_codon:yes stop_codon:yes gene_type:complete
MTKDEFIEEVFELAFGDDALNRDFSYREVLEVLKSYDDKALRLDIALNMTDKDLIQYA